VSSNEWVHNIFIKDISNKLKKKRNLFYNLLVLTELFIKCKMKQKASIVYEKKTVKLNLCEIIERFQIFQGIGCCNILLHVETQYTLAGCN